MQVATFLHVDEAIQLAEKEKLAEQALSKHSVWLRGWVYRKRELKEKIFLVLRDVTGILQCVVLTDSEAWDNAQKLTIESSFEVKGKLKKDKRAPNGYELQVEQINIISIAEDFPIRKYQSTELLLDYRHLWLRSRKMTAILKIRHTVFQAIREFFISKGYYEFHAPIIVPRIAEEGPTLFEVKYFDKKAYLTQTWQLYAEAAIFALEKIFTIAPSFRAEKSRTPRHLTEYWHTEVEAAWLGLDEIMDVAEEMVKHVIARVLEKHKQELALLQRDTAELETALQKKWKRITYDEALKLLEQHGMKVKWGKDLRTLEIEKLTSLFDTPVFVTHFPKEIMAFYKPASKENPKVALCFDLLVRNVGELIGGSERDNDIEAMKKALKKAGENLDAYQFYFDTRRYGAVKHSGFGLGTERLIMWLCGLQHIRDAIAFPRTINRFYP